MKIFLYLIIIGMIFNGCIQKNDVKKSFKSDEEKYELYQSVVSINSHPIRTYLEPKSLIEYKNPYNKNVTSRNYRDKGIHLQIAALKNYSSAVKLKKSLKFDVGYSVYIKRGKLNKVILTGIASIMEANRLRDSRFSGAFIIQRHLVNDNIVYEEAQPYNTEITVGSINNNATSYLDPYESGGSSTVYTDPYSSQPVIVSYPEPNYASGGYTTNNPYGNSSLNTVKGGIKIHKFMTVEKKEELKRLENMVTYILFSRKPNNMKVKERYQQVLDFMTKREARISINNHDNNKISQMNRFIIPIKKHNQNICLRNYNYNFSKKILDYLGKRYGYELFKSEGPFFITTRDRLFDNYSDLNILYLNLDKFDKSAIIETIKIYKDRLSDKKNLKISFLDDLKFSILAFIVPANENIRNIAKLISTGGTTSAYASEN